MDALELRISETLDIFEEPALEVGVFVNGEDLRDLVRRVELPFATTEGDSGRAGCYAGLPPKAVFSPSRRLLGDPSNTYDDGEEKICLLGCGCGVVGCWPLRARISVKDETVVWCDFEQPHRSVNAVYSSEQRIVEWRYGGFGPFVFGRDQYLAELKRAGESRI